MSNRHLAMMKFLFVLATFFLPSLVVGYLRPNTHDYNVMLQTVYGEARGEPQHGQLGVAHVIRNRAQANRGYWGGNTYAGVAQQPRQFEVWNGRSSIPMHERQAVNGINSWLPHFERYRDPTNGARYYNNPAKEGYPEWTKNVRRGVKIGNHQFYHDWR